MIYVLDLLGVAIFAITGAITAGQKRMDIFGVIVVATVTAVGGGTTRDLVLGMRPFWVSDPLYIIVCLFAGLGTFVYVYFAKPPLRVLLIGDAFGLAIFYNHWLPESHPGGCLGHHHYCHGYHDRSNRRDDQRCFMW